MEHAKILVNKRILSQKSNYTTIQERFWSQSFRRKINGNACDYQKYQKKIENNFYDLFISENGLSEKIDLRNWKSIFEGVYNLGRFFINLCRCRGNDVDSSLHANKWKRRIDRNKFKRPMKAYPGIDITEWNYFDAEGSSATMRRSKSNLVQLRRVFC